MVHDVAMQHPVAGVVGHEGDPPTAPGGNQDRVAP